MEEEERNPLKEDPRDFALWKATKPGEDTSWDSPWGPGRPGWHIECSAMARDAFGPVFEIHGGGLDLVFPHHENELAQSRALGDEFAKLWMHNGMLEFGGEKMSKSLGNDVSIRNVLDTWGREVALLFFMTAHWRKPIDFTDDTLAQAKAQVETLAQLLRRQRRPPASRRSRSGSRLRSTTTSTRPTRSRSSTTGAAAASPPICTRASSSSASARSASVREAPPEVVELAEQRQAGARGEGLRRGRPAARRDRRARLGGPRRRRRLRARPAMTREHVYGRRAVREALRGANREVLELWATERAVKAEDWLRETKQPRVQVKLERDLSEEVGTRDHQGVLAWCEPYRYADAYELAATRAAAPRVPRPGQRPEEPRRRLPQRGGRGRDGRRRAVARLRARDAGRLPRRRPARSSTCRSRS